MNRLHRLALCALLGTALCLVTGSPALAGHPLTGILYQFNTQDSGGNVYLSRKDFDTLKNHRPANSNVRYSIVLFRSEVNKGRVFLTKTDYQRFSKSRENNYRGHGKPPHTQGSYVTGLR
jgi:hypothetical protein